MLPDRNSIVEYRMRIAHSYLSQVSETALRILQVSSANLIRRG